LSLIPPKEGKKAKPVFLIVLNLLSLLATEYGFFIKMLGGYKATD